MKKKTMASANIKSTLDVNVPARDGFIFYLSFYKALSTMPPRARLRLYDAITAYALFGREPIDLNTGQTQLFELIRPQLDANERKRRQRYREKASQDNSFRDFNEFSAKTTEDADDNIQDDSEIEYE